MQDGTTSTSSHEGHATFIGQLKEMFPEQTIENMERALMVKGDLAGAIDYLLTEGNKDQSLSKTTHTCLQELSKV